MIRKILQIIIVAAIGLFLPMTVLGAEKINIKDDAYAAKYVSQSIPDPVQLEVGERKTITFKFKNTGTATWSASGSRFLSAYTVEPRYRASKFKGANWVDTKQTAKISGTVKPGAVGELVLQITAPNTPGLYTEQFHLAAENYTWVKGGSFFIKINVAQKKTTTPTPISVAPTSTAPVATYNAHRFILNPEQVEVTGGSRVEIQVAYQNLDDISWQSYGFTAGNQTKLAAGTSISFADELWEGPNILFRKQQEVLSGKTFSETLTLRAPKKAGVYMADLALEVNGTTVPNAGLHIPIHVTANAPDYVPSDDDGKLPTLRMAEEPKIRVGLWKADKSEAQFISADDDYVIYTEDVESGILPVNTGATLRYDGSGYTLTAEGISLSSPQHFRLVPLRNPHAIFTVSNMVRKLDWKGPRNFNKYRGVMEFRLTQDGKDLYAIEEVLFEDYIAGIGETSAIGHMEYIKAILVASRTYAYYIMTHTDKHDKRNFDVVAHTGDQLYLGVVSEEMMPRVVQAAQETRGYMVTYEGNIVITPYFANTSGRTKSWTEVWGGVTKPWLVPVEAIYDKRDKRKLYGHGVGMSARDAAIRAEEEGVEWTSLIKYYYTGVEVEKVYF